MSGRRTGTNLPSQTGKSVISTRSHSVGSTNARSNSSSPHFSTTASRGTSVCSEELNELKAIDETVSLLLDKPKKTSKSNQRKSRLTQKQIINLVDPSETDDDKSESSKKGSPKKCSPRKRITRGNVGYYKDYSSSDDNLLDVKFNQPKGTPRKAKEKAEQNFNTPKRNRQTETPTSRKRPKNNLENKMNIDPQTEDSSARQKLRTRKNNENIFKDTPKSYGLRSTPKQVNAPNFNTPSKTANTIPESYRTPSKLRSSSCKTKLFEESFNNLQLNSPNRTCKSSTKRSVLEEINQNARKTKNINYAESNSDEEACFDSSSESDSDTSYSSTSGEELYKISTRNLRTPKASLKTPSKKFKHAPLKHETPSKEVAKHLSKLNLNSLTPSVQRRVSSIAKPTTPLQEARMKLHVSVLPKSLPCREEEFNNIYSFLHARLSDGTGGCIYISGVPGTGKTATVNEVIRCLRKAMSRGNLDEFEFLEINGMKLSEPRQAYVQLWKQITGSSVSSEAAQKLLQDRFCKTKTKRGMTLLLVDELDLLCTKRQDVVYNLLDWPSKNGAKLVVVTIANTMDLPERILMGKVTSRLGLTRLTFPPYNFKQLEEIVASRLKDQSAFDGETIQLVARKVASVSGDARRALDICRRATEIAETNDSEKVTMIEVKKALEEMIASPKIQAIKHCSDLEKLFLQAVCAEVQRTGIEEVGFKNVYYSMQTLCTFNSEKVPNVTEALGMCARLGAWRLLLCEHSRQDIHQRIVLNVSTDDVQFAINDINSEN